MMLGLVVGSIFGGLATIVATILFGSIYHGIGLWVACIVVVGYVLWFLTAWKYRELLVEWGVIE